MKKIELRSLAEYFGAKLPAAKIKDRDVRIAIVRLYGSLAKANRDIQDEIDSLRTGLVGDKEEEVNKYALLMQKATDEKLNKKEREKAEKEAASMEDCVRINKDFSEGVAKLFEEHCDPDIKKVSLEVIYEALSDCGFIGFGTELSIGAVGEIFKDVII